MPFSVRLFRGAGRASAAGEPVPVGDRLVPRIIEVEVAADGTDPALRMRIEVRQGVPVYTQVALVGDDIRQKDLMNLFLNDWLSQIVAALAFNADGTKPFEEGRGDAIRTIEVARKKRNRRDPKLLNRVAEIYREHFDTGKPTQAVERAFGVSKRTAIRYVQDARAAGLLPATVPGKKKI